MTDRRRTDPLTGEVIEDPPIRPFAPDPLTTQNGAPGDTRAPNTTNQPKDTAMPLIKTLARDMKPGDIITIGGVPVAVELVSPIAGATTCRVIYLKHVGRLILPEDVLYEVERPDPDEALVEVMAQAIRSYNYASNCPASGSWDETTDSIRAAYRSNARAAIAAAREAGLL